jgi:3-oxoacyl-[acyl-carrier protein] reductase
MTTTPIGAPLPLAGRVAMVTGASGSIGAATAWALARDGADLALVDIAFDAAVIAGIRDTTGREVLSIRADVSDATEMQAALAVTLEALGRLDVLVAVAGVTSFGAAATLPEAEWDRVIAINLKGVFLACQAAIAPMRAVGGGRIVTIGSVLAKNGGNARPWLAPEEQVRAGNIAYGAAKAGVHALTLYLAKELAANGITVNCVAPGPVASAMTTALPDQIRSLIPLGRMGRPEDVAEAVRFLVGAGAGFITGEILDVNGGLWPD